METIAYKLPCFCLLYDIWCDQINQCIHEIDPNNFKSRGAIFAFFHPKNAQLSGAKSQNLNSRNVAGCTMPPTGGDISAQHFRRSRQANSVFGGPKFRAGGPKFCTSSLIGTSSKFCLVHLVTMSAMPPVDNYITYFYWKTLTGPRYYNGRGISRPNVEMNCNDIFMRHLWSTWNA